MKTQEVIDLQKDFEDQVVETQFVAMNVSTNSTLLTEKEMKAQIKVLASNF